MHLVLHGQESVESLIEQAESCFGNIINHQLTLPDFSSKPIFSSSLNGKTIWIEPVKNLKQMTLLWEIPHKFTSLETHPTLLVSHVLGHEGNGSLLSKLKQDDLVESLSAGENQLGFENHTFEISVTLTDLGLKHWEKVKDIILSAIFKFAEKQIPKVILMNMYSFSHDWF